MMESFQAMVFDAVGTLLYPDPPAAVVYNAVGKKYGSRLSPAVLSARMAAACQAEEEFDSRHGQVTSEAREIERWRRIVGDTLNDVRDSEACFGELFDHFSHPAAWRCTSGTEEALTALAERGLILGMASNYDRRLRSVVAGRLELAGVTNLVISSEVGRRKPAVEFFRAVERSVCCSGKDILFVGDDLANDYEGPRQAGLAAVLFDPTGKFTGQPIARIDRLADLLSN
jgi:putative hydrolase of the HAD superfamily